MKYPLYGEDGRIEGMLLGYDSDGNPVRDDPDEARRHPWDYDFRGAPGCDLGPCEPIDDLDDDDPDAFPAYSLPIEPDVPWTDIEADVWEDLDEEASDEPPCYEDVLWWAEHGDHANR